MVIVFRVCRIFRIRRIRRICRVCRIRWICRICRGEAFLPKTYYEAHNFLQECFAQISTAKSQNNYYPRQRVQGW
ncbi:hypothetical protein [Coleofasciculus sp. G2-EDA-02]|uniref:hypothetical protein n=1 Tax=Coleofasciculus sp. G2-EDA-02 TaxID=3069529 RepID=UPI0040648235